MVSLNALCSCQSPEQLSVTMRACRGFPCMASRLTSDANSHARGEPLLAELLPLRCLQVPFSVNTSKRSFKSGRINRLSY